MRTNLSASSRTFAVVTTTSFANGRIDDYLRGTRYCHPAHHYWAGRNTCFYRWRTTELMEGLGEFIRQNRKQQKEINELEREIDNLKTQNTNH